jgi:hypothetical protein
VRKSTNKLEYKVIDTVEGLEKVIDLLENGFNWGKKQSKILLSEIPKINNNYGMFGVAIYDNKSPKGAILFVHQGTVSVAGKSVNVINLSSWYMEENYRGIPTISIARYMLEVLKDCLITNYTANEHISKILIRLDFRKMNLKRTSVLIYNALPGLSGIWQRISRIKSKDIILPSIYNSGFAHDSSFDYFEIQTGDKVIKLAGKVVNIQRSVFGLRLKLRSYNIVWTNDEKMLAILWGKIALKIMVHTRTMKLTYDFLSLNFPSGFEEKEMNCLIYGDEKINSVIPFQSELGLF